MTKSDHVYRLGDNWNKKPLFGLALKPEINTPELRNAEYRLHRGMMTDEDVAIFPRRALITNRDAPDMFDLPAVRVQGDAHANYVSDRVRAILDELEPGRHHYITIALDQVLSTGERVSRGNYNLLYNVPFLDPVVPAETMFQHAWYDWRLGSPRKDGGGGLSPLDEDMTITFDAAKIGDHHLWRLFSLTPEQEAEEKRLREQAKGKVEAHNADEFLRSLPQPKYASLSADFFCSEQLRSRLEAEGLFDWGIKRRCTPKFPGSRGA